MPTASSTIQEGATIVDVTLAGMGASPGNCEGDALIAVLDRLDIETGVDLFKLQDAADDYVRRELMPEPHVIVVDRLTATLGYASVPATFLGHAIAATERSGIDTGDIILKLGRRRLVVGQEDMIIDVVGHLSPATR